MRILKKGLKWTIALVILLCLFIGIYQCITDIDQIYLSGKLGLSIRTPSTWIGGSVQPLQIQTIDLLTKRPISAFVTVALTDGKFFNSIIYTGKTDEAGLASAQINVKDDFKLGRNKLVVRAWTGAKIDATELSVDLRETYRILITVDKKWYQPGQTIHVRVLAWEGGIEYYAASNMDVTICLIDPKGNKIFKRTLETDEDGIATVDIQLASELNVGRYRLRAEIGDYSQETILSIQYYKLPTMECGIEIDKDWYLPSERLEGLLTARYFFGKPVTNATVELTVDAYYGEWTTVWKYLGRTDENGEMNFVFNIPEYLVGLPYYDGMTKIILTANVKDAADHEESVTKDVVISRQPILIDLLSFKNTFTTSETINIVIKARYPDGTPVARVQALVQVLSDKNNVVFSHAYVTREDGSVNLGFQAPNTQSASIQVTVIDEDGYRSSQAKTLYKKGSWGESGYSIVLSPEKFEYNMSEVIRAKIPVQYPTELKVRSEYIYVDVISPMDKVTLYTGASQVVNNTADLEIVALETFAPYVILHAYLITTGNNVISDWAKIAVVPRGGLNVEIFTDKPQYLPGDFSKVTVQVTDEEGQPVDATLCVAIVDTSVLALSEKETGFEEVFFALEEEYQKPQWEIHSMPIYQVKNTVMLREYEASKLKSSTVRTATISWAFSPLFIIVFGAMISGKREKHGLFLITFGMIALLLEGPFLAQNLIPPNHTTIGTFASSMGQEDARLQESWGLGGETSRAPLKDTTTYGYVGDGSKASITLPEGEMIRWIFPETMYWDPRLQAPDGTADFNITLAHTITTWSTKVIASTRDAKIGVGYGSILVFKEFFIEPDIPLWVTQDDEITLRVAVFNYIEEELNATLILQRDDWFKLMDNASQSAILSPNSVSKVEWRIKVLKAGLHPVTVFGTANDSFDAVRKQMRVVPNGLLVEQIFNGQTSNPKEYWVSIYPEAMNDSTVAIVKISPGLIAPLITGLDGLLGYPFGCVEQTSSKLIPDILVYRYLDQIKRLTPENRAKLDSYVQTGIQRLLYLQHDDGSFGWWKTDNPNIGMSAWVLNTWSDAVSAGFYIDETAMQALQNWLLAEQLPDGSWPNQKWLRHGQYSLTKLAMTSYVLRSLLKSGIPTSDTNIASAIQYVSSALETAPITDPYEIALAVIALHLAGFSSDQTEIARALDGLVSMAIVDSDGVHWPGGSAIAGETEATAYVAMAFVHSGYRFDLVEGAVKWLLNKRGKWGGLNTTSDTCAFLTLLVLMAERSAEEIDTEVSILINEETVYSLHIDKNNYDVTQIIEVTHYLNMGNNSLQVTSEGKGMINFQVSVSQWLRTQLNSTIETPTIQARRGEIFSVEVQLTPPESVVVPSNVYVQGPSSIIENESVVLRAVGGNLWGTNTLRERDTAYLYYQALREGNYTLGPFLVSYGLALDGLFGGNLLSEAGSVRVAIEDAPFETPTIEASKTIITQSSHPITVTGSSILMSLNITNYGYENITNITVADRLPVSFTFGGLVTPKTANLTIHDNELKFKISELGAGEAYIIEYKAFSIMVGEFFIPGCLVFNEKYAPVAASDSSSLTVEKEGILIRRSLNSTDLEIDDIAEMNVTIFYIGGYGSIQWVIVDIPIPPGFEFVVESLDRVVQKQPCVVRYDIVEIRRVAFIIDAMQPGDMITFAIEIEATSPIRATLPAATVTAMYATEVFGKTTAETVTSRYGNSN